MAEKTNSTVARTDDGTIQITFTIPFALVKEKRLEVAKTLSEKVEVPGFRKGKAPTDKVLEHASPNTILQETLSKILPKLLGNAVEEHKIKPVIYPKFELVKSDENSDWQVRAITCEAPDIDLGDYKSGISKLNLGKKNEIWTPGTEKKSEPKELTRENKEEAILKFLLESAKITIPSILVDEEVDSRLSGLLARLEKLGLTLESYLASTGKKPDNLREEYKKQAEEGLKVDFILTKIADAEKITVDKSEVEASINAATQAEPADHRHDFDTPDRRRFIEIIIRRRKVLDMLLSLT